MAGLGPVLLTKTVTTAGTRVQLIATPLLATRVRFEADGTGTIYVGDVTVSSTVYSAKIIGGSSAVAWEISMPTGAVGQMIDLSKFWFDGTTGAICHVTYFDRTTGGK